MSDRLSCPLFACPPQSASSSAASATRTRRPRRSCTRRWSGFRWTISRTSRSRRSPNQHPPLRCLLSPARGLAAALAARPAHSSARERRGRAARVPGAGRGPASLGGVTFGCWRVPPAPSPPARRRWPKLTPGVVARTSRGPHFCLSDSLEPNTEGNERSNHSARQDAAEKRSPHRAASATARRRSGVDADSAGVSAGRLRLLHGGAW